LAEPELDSFVASAIWVRGPATLAGAPLDAFATNTPCAYSLLPSAL
jgi:hypothetical protein